VSCLAGDKIDHTQRLQLAPSVYDAHLTKVTVHMAVSRGASDPPSKSFDHQDLDIPLAAQYVHTHVVLVAD
jgi:hypothetical protein